MFCETPVIWTPARVKTARKAVTLFGALQLVDADQFGMLSIRPVAGLRVTAPSWVPTTALAGAAAVSPIPTVAATRLSISARRLTFAVLAMIFIKCISFRVPLDGVGGRVERAQVVRDLAARVTKWRRIQHGEAEANDGAQVLADP